MKKILALAIFLSVFVGPPVFGAAVFTVPEMCTPEQWAEIKVGVENVAPQHIVDGILDEYKHMFDGASEVSVSLECTIGYMQTGDSHEGLFGTINIYYHSMGWVPVGYLMMDLEADKLLSIDIGDFSWSRPEQISL